MKTIVLPDPIKEINITKDFGTVYKYNNHIYRTIEDKHKEQVKKLVTDYPLMEKLYRKGLVKTIVAPVCTEQYDFILEHELIDFRSYMEEWSLPAKVDATLMMINLLEELVKNNWCLWDGHPYNTMFNYTIPKWVDFHSIIPLILTTAWWNEFKFYIFDNLIGNETLWDTELHKVMDGSEDLKEKILIFLKEIRKSIVSVKLNPTKTPWYDYPRLSDTNLDDKQISTLQIMEKVKPFCDTFLDIGVNAGWYSKVACNMGYKVVTTDVDESCIADLYIDAKISNSKILPLVSDFKTCLDHIPNKDYPSFADRLRCDVTLSLALLHHLVFFQDCDFSFISKRLDALSRKVAIVQFITRDDSYVKHWLKTSVNKDYSWYTMDNFILSMTKYFPKYQVFKSAPIERKLILFEK
jgi:hypothetical protein